MEYQSEDRLLGNEKAKVKGWGYRWVKQREFIGSQHEKPISTCSISRPDLRPEVGIADKQFLELSCVGQGNKLAKQIVGYEENHEDIAIKRGVGFILGLYY